jgi:hypothetical protein
MSTSYLASANYRPYLQPMPGLGSGSRTTTSVLLGGPRAGAGSAVRIYNYLSSVGQFESALSNYKSYVKANNYRYASNNRNFRIGF